MSRNDAFTVASIGLISIGSALPMEGDFYKYWQVWALVGMALVIGFIMGYSVFGGKK